MSDLVSIEQRGEQYFLSGSLDRDTVPLFWQTRKSWLPKNEHIVIDLSGLKRIDSAGMAMLLHLQQAIVKPQEISFINLPSQLKTLMQLSNIENFLN